MWLKISDNSRTFTDVSYSQNDPDLILKNNLEGDDFMEKTSDQGDRRYLFYL